MRKTIKPADSFSAAIQRAFAKTSLKDKLLSIHSYQGLVVTYPRQSMPICHSALFRAEDGHLIKLTILEVNRALTFSSPRARGAIEAAAQEVKAIRDKFENKEKHTHESHETP